MNQEQVTALLISELLKLSFRLRVAKDQFDPSNPEHGRLAAISAVLAAKQFISEVIQEGAELALPLDQVLYALKDLDAGKVPPLLRPADVKHRAPDPLSKRLFEAAAAALMGLHLQSGLSRKDAATRSGRDLNRLGYRDDKQRKITATQVENWRDKMKAGQGGGDPAAKRYSFILGLLEEKFPNSPKEAIKFFLDALPALSPTTIPQNPTSSLE